MKQALSAPLLCVLSLFLLIFSVSCDKGAEELAMRKRHNKTPPVSENQQRLFEEVIPCGDSATFDLYGGQTTLVGSLIVVNDDSNLYITYMTDGCWQLAETHLYVGDAADIPVNPANTPIPGHFPYGSSNINSNSVTYVIPLADLPSCYVIAAHAAVVCNEGEDGGEEETAWSFGTEFPNTNRWGWYSEYCTQFCGSD